MRKPLLYSLLFHASVVMVAVLFGLIAPQRPPLPETAMTVELVSALPADTPPAASLPPGRPQARPTAAEPAAPKPQAETPPAAKPPSPPPPATRVEPPRPQLAKVDPPKAPPQAEPPKPAATKPEPPRPQPPKPEPPKPQPAKVEPAKREPPKPEPAKAEPPKAEPAKPREPQPALAPKPSAKPEARPAVAEKPAELKPEAPAEKTPDKPAAKPAERPRPPPTEAVASKAAEKAAEKPPQKPAEKPVETPAKPADAVKTPPPAEVAKKPEPAKKPDAADDFSQVARTVRDLNPAPTAKREAAPAPARPPAGEAALEQRLAAALQASTNTAAGPPSSQPMSASEIDAVRRQIERCWNVPAGAKSAEVVAIRVEMNPDGTPRTAVVENGAAMRNNPALRATAESALRAVLNPRCHPLKLPPDKYDRWKTMTLIFDPKEMLGA